MKIQSIGLAVVLASLVACGVSSATTPFYGVVNPNNYTLAVDTAIVTVNSDVDTFLTIGWGGSGTTPDTYHFPDLAAWPSKVTLISTINGQPNVSDFSTPQPDSWYRFQYGLPLVPLAMFFGGAQGLEESGSASELLPRLNVRPTVVTTQMIVSVRPVGASRPVVEVLDAAGNRVRSLICKDGAGGPATATWDGADRQGRFVPPGVYFCRYDAPGVVVVRKVLVAH